MQAVSTALKRVTISSGQPRGLAVLCVTEMFVSFAVYGFEALFALYMAHELLTPAHVGAIWGLPLALPVVEWLYGPQPLGAPLAGAIAALVLAAMWVMPLLAAVLADRGVGRTTLVAGGGVLLAAGLCCVAWDRTFLPGLACFLLGYGGVGTLKAQVGGLYAPGDHRRAAAYQMFSLAVQFAVIFAPLAGGWVMRVDGWRAGFGLPACVMMIGVAIYILQRASLVDEGPMSGDSAPAPPLDRAAWGTIAVLVALIPVFSLVLATNMQIFNAYMIWGERHYALTLEGYELPVTALVSLDGGISVLTTLAVLGFWRWWARVRRDPDEIVKICVGAAIGPFAPLVLAFASWRAAQADGVHRISLWWGIAFHVVNDIGFSSVYAIGMALYSRAAPRQLNTTMVSAFVLSLFGANIVVGKLATMLDRISSVRFWLLHAGLGGAGFVLLLVAALLAHRRLAPETSR